MKLLFDLLNKRSVSGDEAEISAFIVNYVTKRSLGWKVQPVIFFR